MRKNTENKNQITEGIIWKQLLLFFFPIMFGTFFQQLYNTADAIIVGKYVGKEALAAVGGSANVIINLLVGFFVGISSGATVVISQFYGAQKKEDVSHGVHTAIALSLVGGLVLTVIGLIFSPTLLRLMGTPADTMQDSILYMSVYFVGMLPSLLFNIGSGILRAVGDSKRPLYYLILCCFINIFLDIIFVKYFNLGVIGVALATLLAQAVSACCILLALMRTDDYYQLSIGKIRFSKNIFGHILLIGLPAGIQSIMYSLSNIIIQSGINSFGTNTVAAWTAYSKLDGIFWMIMGAFGVSITTFVGQNFGAFKLERVRKSIHICLAMSFGTTIVLSTLFFCFGPALLSLFTNDSQVLKIGGQMIRFLVPTYITYISIEILSGALRGVGNAIIPMIMTFLGICVLRILWLLLIVPRFPSLNTVMLSYPITWAVTSICFIIYYLRGSWLKNQI